jgi:hypothetical protein
LPTHTGILSPDNGCVTNKPVGMPRFSITCDLAFLRRTALALFDERSERRVVARRVGRERMLGRDRQQKVAP